MGKNTEEITDKLDEKYQNSKDKKGSKTLVTLLVIALLAASAFGGWLVGASRVVEVTRQKSNEVNQKSEKDSNNTKDETQEEYTVSNEEDMKSKDKIEVKVLDLNKSLNTTGITYSDPKDTGEKVGLTITAYNNKTVTLTTDMDVFCQYTSSTCAKGVVESTEITNFTKNVVSGFVGGEGQDQMGTTLFYLMEDGTIEYTKLFVVKTDSQGNSYYVTNNVQDKDSNGKITGTHYESQGAIKGVKDVVKIYTVQATTGMSGYMTTIGMTRNGSFYDLGYAIRN